MRALATAAAQAADARARAVWVEVHGDAAGAVARERAHDCGSAGGVSRSDATAGSACCTARHSMPRAPLAAARSHILSVPPAAPATTTSSAASNVTHSTALWCPVRLWQRRSAQARRQCTAAAAWRAVACTVRASSRAWQRAQRPLRRVARSTLLPAPHQDGVRLADGPHVDLFVVAAGDHDAAGTATDLHAVHSGRMRRKLLCAQPRDASAAEAHGRRTPRAPARGSQPRRARTELVAALRHRDACKRSAARRRVSRRGRLRAAADASRRGTQRWLEAWSGRAQVCKYSQRSLAADGAARILLSRLSTQPSGEAQEQRAEAAR
jgi:hypothetical protein